LATHTSGLPEWPSNILLNNKVGDANPNYNLNRLYETLSNTKLTRERGSYMFNIQYSSFGSGLLGHILSLKSGGIPYEQLVKDRILNVLGMNDTKIHFQRMKSTIDFLLVIRVEKKLPHRHYLQNSRRRSIPFNCH
jgi:serine-type D-Ala-D-Ala carboxypeptidase/endopeptidase